MPARLVLWAAAPLGLVAFALLRGIGARLPPGDAEDLVAIWEFLVAASVVLWTALASVGLRVLETLPRRRGVGGFLVAVYGAVALLLVLTGIAGIGNEIVFEGQALKNVLIHVIAGVAILPWLLVLKRIQLVTDDNREWRAGPDTFDRIRSLRGKLNGATAAGGGMIAVAIFITGALREAVDAAGGDPTPSSYVLLYGAWLTAVLAAVYLHVFGAIERRARSILDRVPLPDPSSDAFISVAERRAVLAQELNLGGDPRTNLEGLVAVLAPLVGALLTRFGDF